MTPVTIRMKYTPENLQKAFELHYQKMYPIRGRLMQILGIMLLVVGIMLWIIYWNQEQRITQYIYIVAGILLLTAHTIFMRKLGSMTFSRMQSPEQSFDFVISDNGVDMLTSRGTYSIDWEKIEQAIVTKDLIMLYISKMQFYFLPKDSFASESDYNNVVNEVKHRVTNIKQS